MKKITNSMVEEWLGSDATKEDMIATLTQLANGYYSPVTMREEIESYFDYGK